MKVIRYLALALGAFLSMSPGAKADPISPADTAALMVPVLKFTAAINAGAPSAPAGIFTADCVVIDAFGPYRWVGSTGASGLNQWYADYAGATPEEHAKMLAEKIKLVIGKPKFARITGDDAYLEVPGTETFTDDTGAHKQVASWVIIEKKVDGAWLISAHIWALHEDK